MVVQTLLVAPGYIFANDAAVQFHPLVLLSLRSLLASLLFLPVLVTAFQKSEIRILIQKHFSWIFLTAFFGAFLNQLCFIFGIRYTTPAHSAILYSLTPLGVFFISALVLKQERFTLPKFTFVLLAICGTMLIVLDREQTEAKNPLLGNFITLLGVLFWCLYLSWNKNLMHLLSAQVITGIQLSIGAILFLPLGVYFLPANDWSHIQPNGYFGLGYLVIVNSFLSYLLINYALFKLDASQIAVYMNLQPLIATLFSFFVGKASFTFHLLLGGTLVLLSLFLLNRHQSKERILKESMSL
jgi:drug/metabolite transporter (DMT)-like permease